MDAGLLRVGVSAGGLYASKYFVYPIGLAGRLEPRARQTEVLQRESLQVTRNPAILIHVEAGEL
jgi:hypothetical protein